MTSRLRAVLLLAFLGGCGSKSTVSPPVPSSPPSATVPVDEAPWRVAFSTRHDRDRPVPATDSVKLVLASDPTENLIEERHIKGGTMHKLEPTLVADDLPRRRELGVLLPRISKQIGQRSRSYALGGPNGRRWGCMPSIPILPSDGLSQTIVIEVANTETKLEFVWDAAAERPPLDVARLLELVEGVVKTEPVSGCER